MSRARALDKFFDELWHVGLWTLAMVLVAIWVAGVMRLVADMPTEPPTQPQVIPQ